MQKKQPKTNQAVQSPSARRAVVSSRLQCLYLGLWVLCPGLILPLAASAQHAGHAGYQQSSHGIEILAQTETLPANDAVLARAPEQLRLQFPRRVRLVKLTLHDQNHDWVDISFRYDPIPGEQFVWQLPGLQQASYYTANWAILGANDELIRGSFSFAFGPEAQAPSVIRRAEMLLLQEQQSQEGVRNVSPPPTRIILDQDSPNYDPPFTIKLNEEDRD